MPSGVTVWHGLSFVPAPSTANPPPGSPNRFVGAQHAASAANGSRLSWIGGTLFSGKDLRPADLPDSRASGSLKRFEGLGQTPPECFRGSELQLRQKSCGAQRPPFEAQFPRVVGFAALRYASRHHGQRELLRMSRRIRRRCSNRDHVASRLGRAFLDQSRATRSNE